jgi:hypothetical protein
VLIALILQLAIIPSVQEKLSIILSVQERLAIILLKDAMVLSCHHK